LILLHFLASKWQYWSLIILFWLSWLINRFLERKIWALILIFCLILFNKLLVFIYAFSLKYNLIVYFKTYCWSYLSQILRDLLLFCKRAKFRCKISTTILTRKLARKFIDITLHKKYFIASPTLTKTLWFHLWFFNWIY